MKPTAYRKTILINRILFILSVFGVLVAIYVLQSFLRNTGIVCISGGGCEAVRKHSASWPLGIPVPAVGLVGYAILAVCAFLRTTKLTASARTVVTRIMTGMAAFGVVFVTWFTYTELFVIHGICTWCAVSSVNMYIVFLLLMFERRLAPSRS